MEKEVEILLEEYRQLKVEQIRRIGFRDNLIYVTLTAVGAIVAFVISNKADYVVLLVIPWVCLILGWTYLVNDEKISSIGKYINEKLATKISENIKILEKTDLFNWESFHKTNKGRKRRKLVQLFIDLFTFVGPGVGAIIGFSTLSAYTISSPFVLVVIESLLLMYLFYEIIEHAR